MIFIKDGMHLSIARGDTGLLTVSCSGRIQEGSLFTLSVRRVEDGRVFLEKIVPQLTADSFFFEFSDVDTALFAPGEYIYNITQRGPGLVSTLVGQRFPNDCHPKFYVMEAAGL